MVDDGDILQVVQEFGTPEAICKRLVTMANEHGGEDNVTAVVIAVVEGGRADVEFARTQQLHAK
jgi:serine/threonine protein phosphatase PrpC